MRNNPVSDEWQFRLDEGLAPFPQVLPGCICNFLYRTAPTAQKQSGRPFGGRPPGLPMTGCSRSLGSIFQLALVQIAIMLDARHAQALHARTVDRALPRGEFLDG